MIRFLPCSVDVVKCLPNAYHNQYSNQSTIITLFKRVFKMMKNGGCCIAIAFLVAELLKILISANKITCALTRWTQNDVKSQKMEYI